MLAAFIPIGDFEVLGFDSDTLSMHSLVPEAINATKRLLTPTSNNRCFICFSSSANLLIYRRHHIS